MYVDDMESEVRMWETVFIFFPNALISYVYITGL